MNSSLMIVELGINATQDDLLDQMRSMRTARATGSFKNVICTIRGFDSDRRELYEIPQVREFCSRLVYLGFISYLDFTTALDPERDPAISCGYGAAEVLLCSENRMFAEKAMRKDEAVRLLEELSEKYTQSNDAADALIGPYLP